MQIDRQSTCHEIPVSVSSEICLAVKKQRTSEQFKRLQQPDVSNINIQEDQHDIAQCGEILAIQESAKEDSTLEHLLIKDLTPSEQICKTREPLAIQQLNSNGKADELKATFQVNRMLKFSDYVIGQSDSKPLKPNTTVSNSVVVQQPSHPVSTNFKVFSAPRESNNNMNMISSRIKTNLARSSPTKKQMTSQSV